MRSPSHEGEISSVFIEKFHTSFAFAHDCTDFEYFCYLKGGDFTKNIQLTLPRCNLVEERRVKTGPGVRARGGGSLIIVKKLFLGDDT